MIHDIWGAKRAGATTVWVNHDLPGEIVNLPVAERSNHHMLKELVAAGIDRDLNAAAYPEVSILGSMPDFLIKTIDELLEVISLLV